MIRALVLIAAMMPFAAIAQVFEHLDEIATPVGRNAREPALTALPNGAIAMVWTEPEGENFAVKTAVWEDESWTVPVSAVSSNDLFVNWADFPAIAAFDDGMLAVSWLKENADLSYAYDINLALSGDGGQTWGDAITPHTDRSARQHGFVTLLATGPDAITAVWLDARDYDSQIDDDSFGNAMQLRSTTIGRDGSLGRDVALDIRTCQCCQTSAAVAGNGDVLVVYRDLSADDIRDIYIVRRRGDVWSDPVSVHADGWEISGCPINGPSIDAHGDNAVVAWFTAAENVPAVKIAFSQNGGQSFGTAFRVDGGDGVGRVATVMLPNAEALITWVEWRDEGEALMMCRATPDDGCVARQIITINTVPGSINFPQIAHSNGVIYLAWTQPLIEGDIRRTIRMTALSGLIR
ncbi:hypothetical protein OAN307_c42190 [Octadecabacter antarcticus 307]|uniref:Exo-alpha-sialidase n=1 Tax=Octadecabacter antarcticus 307 TaxID=391626 RepID=M9RGT2_9RHOB|nr:hypothetical protein [Octadecabacter antarcticus]AGI69616.1 hypothetical protein OAN307_c42190 [Octadecabacter antarcticus 307]